MPTSFSFDGSSSTDLEDDVADLQVRWDWENDGTWDTEYSTTKTATHQYGSIGTYTVKMIVMDSNGDTDDTTKTVTVPNTAPTGSFTISPDSGTIDTVFTFDASGCSDLENDVSLLQVRWDWENDGTWDTDYSTTKTATHQYSSIGTYTVNLEVKDNGNSTSTLEKNVIVEDNTTGTLTDINGNIYKTVKIGNQWWMAENLKVTKYRNGENIQKVIQMYDWVTFFQNNKPAYCAYNNVESNVDTYGYLYNWHTLRDVRGIAPEGWHVPSDAEWTELENFLSSDADEKLKSTSGWSNVNNETDNYGFNALPAGYRALDANFYGMGSSARFWSRTEYGYSNYYAWARNVFSRYWIGMGYGHSVRLVKN